MTDAPFPEMQFSWEDPEAEDVRYKEVTCAKCGETGTCTPYNDYFTTPLWDGEGRLCERCFQKLLHASIKEDWHNE